MKAHLLLVASALIAGCSDTPSSGDIEKVLEAAVGPCQNVEVVDVKKTNGYQEDGFYRVEYKFGLVVKETAKLKNLYEEWRAEYEQFEARKKIFDEYTDRINQLIKEAEALSAAAAGPEPRESDFNHLANSFNAYSAAKLAWLERANEAAKPKNEEITKLRNERLQLPQLKFNIIGKEFEAFSQFFYAGCPQSASQFIDAATPRIPDSHNGIRNLESILTFTRADLTGKMSMRKTENGWRKF